MNARPTNDKGAPSNSRECAPYKSTNEVARQRAARSIDARAAGGNAFACQFVTARTSNTPGGIGIAASSCLEVTDMTRNVRLCVEQLQRNAP
jgi:hypothetical protein